MWICTRCGERNAEAISSCPNCAGARGGETAVQGLVCPACGSEYRQGFSVCADCSVARVDAVPAPRGGLRKVWVGTDHTEAELLRMALRRVGIESILENEGGASYAIGMGTSLVPYVIAVAEPDVDKALDVLKSEREFSGPADRYIPPLAMIRFPCACGQSLEVPPDFDGLEMDCPFCGRTVVARKS